MLQLLVHHFGERLRLLLPYFLIHELVVEMVLGLLHVGKADEELSLDARLVLGLMDSVHELRFVQFLARHGHDTVHLAHHMHGRGLFVFTAHLHKVVHVVPEQARIGRHIGAITLAELQLVDLPEMLVRAVQLTLFHELVVMELREEHRLVRLVQREAETALGRDIAQLLVVGFVPIELVHELIHVDLGVATFPRTEILQPRPEILGVHMARLGEDLTQLCCTFGPGTDVGIEHGTYLERDLEIFAYRSLLDIIDHLLEVLVHHAQQLQYRGGVGSRPEGHIAMLHRQAHQHIVTRRVVRDGHDLCRTRVMFLDDRRYIAHQHAAHRTEQGAVRRVAFAFLADRGEDMSAEDTTAVLDEVPRPYMTHLAIHILEVLVRHRDPFGLGGRARGRGVHIRLAGE